MILGGNVRKPSVLKTLAALALTLVSPALAAGTPAGTVIQNQATLEFTPEGGTPTFVPTQPVQTTVSALCAVSVLPNGTVAAPGQSYTLLPTESTLLKYTVSNTGNAENKVALSVAVDAASQFTPTDLTLHIDANNNGVIDANEPAVTEAAIPADGSVTVLVSVGTTANSRGNAYLNLVGACATNLNGLPAERDDNNVALVTVGEPPSLNITKTFAPNAVRPGEETLVTVTATNNGAGASRPVTVTDFLNTPDMRDFVFKSASAQLQGAGVIEYSNDGSTWVTSETAPVSAIRARTDSLAPGATLTLTFRLIAPSTTTGVKRNIASLQSDNINLEAPADITVRYLPSIAIGPIGNPTAQPGGELSTNDKQVKNYALLGQEICFPHTVQNLGDRPDSITISGVVELGTGTIRYTEMDGTPITEPFIVPNLAPNATKDFNACYTPKTANISSAQPAFQARLTAKSSMGAADNQTIDCILNIAPNVLSPLKSVDSGDGNVVAPGQTLTYTLTFKNEQSFTLNNVVIRDNLKNITVNGTANAAALEFISADNGGVLEGTEVVWRFASLAPGQTVVLTVKAKVPADLPDGAVIYNTYTVTSDEVTTPVPSNTTPSPVFDQAHLTMVKTSTPSTPVAIGQTITYTFTVTNTSTTGALTLIKVADDLPIGLDYVVGSSNLDGTPITPTVGGASGRVYTWEIPGLAPGATAKINFDATVTTAAGSQIKNTAVATAISNGGEVKTPTSSVLNAVDARLFTLADIVGYVFMDMNRNGIYEQGVDIPCQNARVILANGRIALTDAQGRYHFSSVQEGSYAVRLDPNSVAAQNLSLPQDAGKPGSRLTYVRNLTSLDFPLAPDAGDIAVIRDTTLRMTSTLPGQMPSSMTVRKQVFSTDEMGVYRVQLIISNNAELKDVQLTDPLPAGATLADGQNNLTYVTLPSGERAVTYRFRWAGDPKGAVTDPTASWRY